MFIFIKTGIALLLMEQGDITTNDIQSLFITYFSLSVLLLLVGKAQSYFSCCISTELLRLGKIKILTPSSVPLKTNIFFLHFKTFYLCIKKCVHSSI